MTNDAVKQKSLVQTIATKYGIATSALLPTLKATAFQSKDEVSNEQMAALLVVANEYDLNPFTKELFAFPDRQNGIVPVVSIDGWSRIINSHPEMDGISFDWSKELVKSEEHKDVPAWCDCLIYRKDRSKPIVVREFFDEVYRPPFAGKYGKVTGPWQSHTKRMLRHKTMIQGARIAFGFAGIYDPDEAQRIKDVEYTEAEYEEVKPAGQSGADKLQSALGGGKKEAPETKKKNGRGDTQSDIGEDEDGVVREEALQRNEPAMGNPDSGVGVQEAPRVGDSKDDD